ncbi:hypothetical protein Pcinc_018801 [Petrolisthes cinctipes]|uniref:Uncharacterized protein n=1 Tax=Petrolisthes cinctipes TaxID=88211 RepID=A0AAE1FMF9_PETCI|nr:hypothetical protein Pcinc_018801 [Petrolisthes cinctipes]
MWNLWDMLQVGQDEAWEKVDGGSNSNSMGLEALAIFTALTFLVRVLADIAIRVRNGRSLISGSYDGNHLNHLSQVVLTLMYGASLLYDLDMET